ncbi:MAG: hypothetical protein AAB656_03460 [Patescibacteria group bacterium]
MKTKLYTMGQIAKLYKVPLKKVSLWAKDIMEPADMWGRKHGVIPIKSDPYGRNGFPRSLVDLFPMVPDKETINKLIRKVDKTYQPKVRK